MNLQLGKSTLNDWKLLWHRG